MDKSKFKEVFLLLYNEPMVLCKVIATLYRQNISILNMKFSALPGTELSFLELVLEGEEKKLFQVVKKISKFVGVLKTIIGAETRNNFVGDLVSKGRLERSF